MITEQMLERAAAAVEAALADAELRGEVARRRARLDQLRAAAAEEAASVAAARQAEADNVEIRTEMASQLDAAAEAMADASVAAVIALRALARSVEVYDAEVARAGEVLRQVGLTGVVADGQTFDGGNRVGALTMRRWYPIVDAGDVMVAAVEQVGRSALVHHHPVRRLLDGQRLRLTGRAAGRQALDVAADAAERAARIPLVAQRPAPPPPPEEEDGETSTRSRGRKDRP